MRRPGRTLPQSVEECHSGLSPARVLVVATPAVRCDHRQYDPPELADQCLVRVRIALADLFGDPSNSYRGPARGQSLLSGASQGIRTGSAKSIVIARRYEQFLLADWVVFCWDLCARLFWDFAASGAGRRRPGRIATGWTLLKQRDDEKTRRAQNRPAAGHISPGILSLDDATDNRSRINSNMWMAENF